jgi:NAD(P)-dependent dehydrogenase (short-subunit alcohol dehydrogenase family)
VAAKGEVFALSTDVTDFKSVQKAIAAANAFHKRPTDKLICCAGLAAPGLLVEQDVEVFHRMMDLNYFGVVHTVKAALPAMIDADNRGQIVIIGSGCSMLSFIGYTQYASSKYALRGLAEALRNELRLYNMTTSVFYPGNIDSPGFAEENRSKPAETLEIEGNSTPEKPDAVADSLLSGLQDGQFAITNDPLLFVLRLISNGVSPRFNSPLELLLFPLCVVIQMGFGIYMDFVVSQSANKKRAAKKTN